MCQWIYIMGLSGHLGKFCFLYTTTRACGEKHFLRKTFAAAFDWVFPPFFVFRSPSFLPFTYSAEGIGRALVISWDRFSDLLQNREGAVFPFSFGDGWWDWGRSCGSTKTKQKSPLICPTEIFQKNNLYQWACLTSNLMYILYVVCTYVCTCVYWMDMLCI